jgi:hypothetical protein
MFICILGFPINLNLLFFIIGFLCYIIISQYSHLKFFYKINLFLKQSKFLSLFIIIFIVTFILLTILNSLESNTKKNLINFGLNIVSDPKSNINLEEFPLNLIPDIQLLLSACLIFYVVILNIQIVQYIIKKDYIKYIPDSGI